jgi:hypothetical protein
MGNIPHIPHRFPWYRLASYRHSIQIFRQSAVFSRPGPPIGSNSRHSAAYADSGQDLLFESLPVGDCSGHMYKA